ncbi:hypothetical protein ElyMa_000535500 [Elysia marginata]|uniref:Uncharacterized protein n=1 Tax=Elysia marginata TaxID=1093978 RepID=A0AAV4G0I9_9GAST|nr:hypothetical protein ElyMa_000535500 [Elysia marginata]
MNEQRVNSGSAQQYSGWPNGANGQGSITFTSENGQQQHVYTGHNFDKAGNFQNLNQNEGHAIQTQISYENMAYGVPNGNEMSAGNLQAFQYNSGNFHALGSNPQLFNGTNLGASPLQQQQQQQQQLHPQNVTNVKNPQTHQDIPTYSGGFQAQSWNPEAHGTNQVRTRELDQAHIQSTNTDGGFQAHASLAQSPGASDRKVTFDQSQAANHENIASHTRYETRDSNFESLSRNTNYVDNLESSCRTDLRMLSPRDYRMYKTRAASPPSAYQDQVFSRQGFQVNDNPTTSHRSSPKVPRSRHTPSRTLFLPAETLASFEDDEDVISTLPYSGSSRSSRRIFTNRFSGQGTTRISPIITQSSMSNTRGYSPIHGSGASIDFSPV